MNFQVTPTFVKLFQEAIAKIDSNHSHIEFEKMGGYFVIKNPSPLPEHFKKILVLGVNEVEYLVYCRISDE